MPKTELPSPREIAAKILKPEPKEGKKGKKSYLERVDTSLRANSQVAYIGFEKRINPLHNRETGYQGPLEVVNIDIAPISPIYDVEALQEFMDSLFDFEPDEQVEFRQKPKHMQLGRLFFTDPIGRWTRTTMTQFTVLDHSVYNNLEHDPKTVNYVDARGGTEVVEELDYRLTTVSVFPDESLAYFVAAFRQGETIGVDADNYAQAINYLKELTKKNHLPIELLDLMKNKYFTVTGGVTGA